MAASPNAHTCANARGNNLRVLVAFLKRDIFSAPSVLSSLLMFLALFYSKDIVSPGASTVGLFIFPVSWNNAMGLVALAAGICSAANLAQERTAKFSRYVLLRISRRRYLVTRFISIGASTGLATFAAFLAFAFLCNFESGGTLLPSDVTQVEVQTMSTLLSGAFPLLWFLPIFATEFMFGVAVGSLGVCATVFTPNRFIGYSAPFIILFAWNQISSWVGLPAWLNPLELSKYTFELDNAALTFGAYIAAYIGFVLLLFAVYYFKGVKEVKNDS